METQSFAYVTNSQSGTVSVIDIATNRVVAEPLVRGRPTGIASTPDGKRIYVTNALTSIAVLDTASNIIIAEIEMRGPIAIAMAKTGGRAYVANFDGSAASASILDFTTNMVAKTIPLGEINENIIPSMGVALTPNDQRAYVSYGSSDLFVIDTATDSVADTVPVLPLGQRASVIGIAVTPDGRQAFVPSGMAVAVFETMDNNLLLSVPTGEATAIAVSPDGNDVYVAHAGAIKVIDVFTKALKAQIPVGPSNAIAFAPDGKRAYVANVRGVVTVVDTDVKRIEGEIPVGDGPSGITIASFTSSAQMHPVP